MIRPGGELRFYEHVRALQPRRDTLAAEQAGFAIERCTRFAFKPFPFPFPTAPHVLGIARRAA